MLRIRSLPLRHTLAVALSAVAAVGVLLSMLVARNEMRRLDRIAAGDRISLVLERLESMASTSAEQRLQVKRATARDPAVIAALRGDAVDDEALHDALDPLRTGTDIGLPVQLWTRNGAVIFSDPPEPFAGERAPSPPVPLDSVPSYGAFHQTGGEVQYYSTSPVLENGALLGWVVQLRRIGNAGTAAQLEPLIGSDARVLFHFPGDSLWITLAGEPVTAPVRMPPWDSTITYEADGRTVLLRARQVRETPWSVMVEMPESIIAAGEAGYVRRMLLAALLLVLAGAAVAAVLSRRLTRGLRHLAEASDSIGHGNYDARVERSVGGEEMARVAAAFNAMAEQVAASHAALEAQLREAGALTAELSAANVRAEEARRHAERAARAKSDFLATMSHEIRTPINAVLGFCQVLDLDTLPQEKRRDYLQRTERAARQLATLVDDVLDLSKIQSGAMSVRSVPGPVLPVIEGACAMLSEAVARKRLQLEVEVEPDLQVTADPQRLQQIMLNLMSNAVKFTPDGGTIQVTAASVPGGAGNGARAAGGEVVCITVSDSGIGIAPDQLDRIFEPFIQADTGYTREYGGTGLGLSISRRLARLMDGDIVVDSMPGAGSRFTLRLPGAAVQAGVTHPRPWP